MDDKERYHEICEPRFDRLQETIEKVLELLRGNGTPGLINRINSVEMKINEIVETRKGLISFLMKNWMIILVILMILLNFLKSNAPLDIHAIAEQVKALQTP